ncbi:MAG: hypothetical protein IH933_05785 [Euryarchaeota archaeon]|jgi:hypothetical protein|nr:hypothetical protein [Euryarchaeota archaeon]
MNADKNDSVVFAELRSVLTAAGYILVVAIASTLLLPDPTASAGTLIVAVGCLLAAHSLWTGNLDRLGYAVFAAVLLAFGLVGLIALVSLSDSSLPAVEWLVPVAFSAVLCGAYLLQ